MLLLPKEEREGLLTSINYDDGGEGFPDVRPLDRLLVTTSTCMSSAERTAPLHAHTEDWRASLGVGDEIEVSDHTLGASPPAFPPSTARWPTTVVKPPSSIMLGLRVASG